MGFHTFKEYVLYREMAARKQLNRIVKMANDPDRLVVILSASRNGAEIFPGATKAMEKDIRSRGYTVTTEEGEHFKRLPGEGPVGITPTVGGYPEGEQDVREKSLFVSLPKGYRMPPDEEIIDFFVSLGEKYDQMGVLIKLPGEAEAHEYTTRHHHDLGGGHKIPYKDPHLEKEPAYYTRPRFRGTSGKYSHKTKSLEPTSTASDRDALTYNVG